MHIPAYLTKNLSLIATRLILLVGAATTTALPSLQADDSKPIDIGSRLELFVDDTLIDHKGSTS